MNEYGRYNLIIVESPTKAKTISKYLKELPESWIVTFTKGHLFDLPSNKLSLVFGENEDEFKADWQLISSDTKKITNDITKLSKEAQAVFIATDDDREGERIASDLLLFIKNDNIERIVFREITKKMVKEQLYNSIRDIDENIVSAAKTNRYIDREIGYLISSIINKKINTQKEPIAKGVGRVISPALALLCEVESRIEAHVSKKYRILKIIYLYEGKSFDAYCDIRYDYDNDLAINRDIKELYSNIHKVDSYTEIIDSKSPKGPLNTVDLQYSAFYIKGIMPNDTMSSAQRLFERGLITYHRTDSHRLSKDIFISIKNIIVDLFGDSYTIDIMRDFSEKKKKNDQEIKIQDAHEAIRPTYFDKEHFPKNIKFLYDDLTKQDIDVYYIIWARCIASQMSDSTYDRSVVEIKVNDMNFYSRAKYRLFDGWEIVSDKLIAIKETRDGTIVKYNDDIKIPKFEANDILTPLEIMQKEDETRAPKRYGVGRFVSTVYRLGFGRPSTLGGLVERLLNKGYVTIRDKDKVLIPTQNGKLVNEWTKKNFAWLIDIKHAKEFEDSLEKIENGEVEFSNSLVYDYYNKIKESALELGIEIKDNDDSKPSEAQIKLIKSIAEKKGLNISQDLFTDKEKAKLFLKRNATNVDVKDCIYCKQGKIIERDSFFGCDNKDCNFIITKKSLISFFKKFQCDIEEEALTSIVKKIATLSGGKFENLISKEGKVFSTTLIFEENKDYGWGVSFGKRNNKK